MYSVRMRMNACRIYFFPRKWQYNSFRVKDVSSNENLISICLLHFPFGLFEINGVRCRNWQRHYVFIVLYIYWYVRGEETEARERKEKKKQVK